jgi:hypothetical protein
MARFRGSYRGIPLYNVTTRSLLIASVAVAVLIVALVVTYWAFDLGAVLPRRRR